MDILGRYYTQDLFSNLLVNQFKSDSPSKILELGVGGGALLKAAAIRWKNADFYATDIDKNSISIINENFPFVKTFAANSLNKNIDKKLNIKVGSIDLAVCNPPYLRINLNHKFSNLFKEANLPNSSNQRKITSDMIFLAQNLRLLRHNGELGIILPDSLLTGHEFKCLRQDLIDNHNIKGIIELPESIFPKTDARTHILILEKGFSQNKKIPLYISDKKGNCYDQIEIKPELLIKRMDFSFHKWNINTRKDKDSKKLFEINATITRGKHTHKELKLSNNLFLHTTNLKHRELLSLKNNIKNNISQKVIVKKNDILLARVGRGCIGKVSLINSGQTIISDCIYRIRVPNNLVTQVWESLISKKGQAWLKANSHGVCAKVISKKDLLNFPISISKE